MHPESNSALSLRDLANIENLNEVFTCKQRDIPEQITRSRFDAKVF